jgi:acetate kinase
MTRNVVTLNAGSSSLKFALFALAGERRRLLEVGLAEMVGPARRISVRDDSGELVHEESWPAGASPFHTDALRRVMSWW